MNTNRGINMGVHTAALAIASALAVATTGSTVAAAAPAQPIAAGQCVFQFHLGGPYLRDGAMMGGGYVDCKIPGPADAFSTILRIKYKSGAGWVTRGSAPSEAVPAPVLNLATYAQCEPGGWVLEAEMWDTRGGRTDHYVNTSAPTITGC